MLTALSTMGATTVWQVGLIADLIYILCLEWSVVSLHIF